MQYDTIEELMLELSLYPNKKIDILEDCAGKCRYGWFAIAKDGNCALFDKTGELDDINKVKSIDRNMVLEDTEKIIIPDAVTVIQDYSFYRHTKLTDVMIPDKVTSIGDAAFYNCRRLINVTIGNNVTSIGNNAFSGCKGLTSVTIGNSVTSIGSCVFSGCSGLMSVTITNNVTSIGEYAFANCTNLTSMMIPDSVTNIGESVFWGCSNLKELILKGKTIEEVKSMKNYPFGIEDESIIKCER